MYSCQCCENMFTFSKAAGVLVGLRGKANQANVFQRCCTTCIQHSPVFPTFLHHLTDTLT